MLFPFFVPWQEDGRFLEALAYALNKQAAVTQSPSLTQIISRGPPRSNPPPTPPPLAPQKAASVFSLAGADFSVWCCLLLHQATTANGWQLIAREHQMKNYPIFASEPLLTFCLRIFPIPSICLTCAMLHKHVYFCSINIIR